MGNRSKGKLKLTIVQHGRMDIVNALDRFRVMWGFQGDSNHPRSSLGKGRNLGRLHLKGIFEMPLDDRIKFHQSGMGSGVVQTKRSHMKQGTEMVTHGRC